MDYLNNHFRVVVKLTDWWERPTQFEEWEENIDCMMAIDENGITDLEHIRKNLMSYIFGKDVNTDRWFTISGAVMCREDFLDFKESIITLKENHWPEGMFNYKSGVKRVVFHSREIRKREGPFNPKVIDYQAFVRDLSNMIDATPFSIYSASIDKVKHVIKYNNPFHVYTLCLEFIVERFCRQLQREGKTGILLLESRGKNEDHFFVEFLVDFLQKGNRYTQPTELSCIAGVYFNPKWSRKMFNKGSYINLELADLVSFPIHKYVKFGTKDLSYEIVEKKLNNYPYVNGYGLKIFP